MNGEFTLCGDAFDAPDSEEGWEAGPFRETIKRIITCPRCITIIKLCRYVSIPK
jgi:hypothetical protein